jgi:hypothetical protein
MKLNIRSTTKNSVVKQSRTVNVNQAINTHAGRLPGLQKYKNAKNTISVKLPHSTTLFPGLRLNIHQKKSKSIRNAHKLPPML